MAVDKPNSNRTVIFLTVHMTWGWRHDPDLMTQMWLAFIGPATSGSVWLSPSVLTLSVCQVSVHRACHQRFCLTVAISSHLICLSGICILGLPPAVLSHCRHQFSPYLSVRYLYIGPATSGSVSLSPSVLTLSVCQVSVHRTCHQRFCLTVAISSHLICLSGICTSDLPPVVLSHCRHQFSPYLAVRYLYIGPATSGSVSLSPSVLTLSVCQVSVHRTCHQWFCLTVAISSHLIWLSGICTSDLPPAVLSHCRHQFSPYLSVRYLYIGPATSGSVSLSPSVLTLSGCQVSVHRTCHQRFCLTVAISSHLIWLSAICTMLALVLSLTPINTMGDR